MGNLIYFIIGWVFLVVAVYIHMFYDINREKLIKLRDAFTEEE